MHIEDASPAGERFSALSVVHKDQSLIWTLGFYSRPQVDVDNVFVLLNQYFASLDGDTQARIFELYEQMRNAIDNVVDPTMLQLTLTELCGAMYRLITYEDIQAWTRRHANIPVPPSIKDRYGELDISQRHMDGVDYEKRTYLRDDYLELVNLAILLKPMVPIWSEYATLLTQVKTDNNYKEYQAMQLLRGSSAIKVQPLDRLREYIEVTVPELKNQMSAALGGLGSSELPDWLMSMVVIRKLVIADLISGEDSSNIVSVVYHHVRNTLKSLDRKFVGRIKGKPKPSGNEDDENKSLLETYKIKQSISDGDLMTLTVYTEQTTNLATQIYPEVDVDTVELCRDAVNAIVNTQPTEGQLTILRWMMSRVIPTRALDNISRKGLMSCQAATQAVLWSLGFPDLAILLTASEVRDRAGGLLGGVDSRSRIPKDFVNRFVELYPHYSESGARDRDRQSNVTCRAIDAVAKDFIKCDWRSYAPKSLNRLSPNMSDRGIVSPPPDLKVQLSQLVVWLAENTTAAYAVGEI